LPEDEQIRLLREILRWTRETALPATRARVEQLVDSDEKKRVYEAIADGTQSMRALEKSTGVRRGEISDWVKVWEAGALVEHGSSPPKALFSLRELGIALTPTGARAASKETSP
jgi:hypothetical protein